MQKKKKWLTKTSGVLVGMAVLTFALGFTACNKPAWTQPSSGGDTVQT